MASIPRDVSQITTSWINDLLHNQGTLSAAHKIKKIEFQDIKGDRGGTGAVTRIILSYDEEEPSYPKSLVLKMSPLNSPVHSAREAFFYQEFGNHFAHYLPGILFAHGDNHTGATVLLMNDIKESHKGTGVNFLLGNQVWGVPEGTVDETNRPEYQTIIERVFTVAAEFHASNWNNKSLFQTTWLKANAWYQGKDQETWENAVQFAKSNWKTFKNAIAKGERKLKLSQIMEDVMDNSFNTSWEHFQEHIHSTPFTLSHGDFHAGNMFWSDRDPNLVLHDWSEVGLWEPLADIGQFVISDVPIDLWKGRDKEWLKSYWNKVVSLGVNGEEYTFDRCWADYSRAPVERWIFLLSIIWRFVRNDHAIQYYFDQTQAFIERHPCDTYRVKSVIILIGPK